MINAKPRLFRLCLLLAPFALAAAPAFAAQGERGPSELIFVAQLALLMLVGRLFGEAMTRIKQPGVALGEALPESMLADPGKRLITSLFLGTALSIASVKIVATVVREMNFLRRTVGQIILASAIIDDTVGWMITAVIFSLALQGHVDTWSVTQSILGTLAFMGLSLTV